MTSKENSSEGPASNPSERRQFLQGTAAALAVATPLSWLATSEDAAARPPPPTPRQPFDYAHLKGLAHSLAAAPYQPPQETLPPAVARLDWDHWQAIRFR